MNKVNLSATIAALLLRIYIKYVPNYVRFLDLLTIRVRGDMNRIGKLAEYIRDYLEDQASGET